MNAPSSERGPHRARVLLVDHHPEVIERARRGLGRRFDLLTAGSGSDGLTLLDAVREVAVIISELRLPAMEGPAFREQTRAVAPDAVHVLLTDRGEFNEANEVAERGRVFRLVPWPCADSSLAAAVDAAVEQHRLVSAERVVLEETLRRSVSALAEALAVTHPAAAAHASRVARRALAFAERLGLHERWQIEVAATCRAVGFVTVTPELCQRILAGAPLVDEESAMAALVAPIGAQLLAGVPRLEGVRALIEQAASDVPFAEVCGHYPQLARAASALRLAIDLDLLECAGVSPAEVALRVVARRGIYGDELVCLFLEEASGR